MQGKSRGSYDPAWTAQYSETHPHTLLKTKPPEKVTDSLAIIVMIVNWSTRKDINWERRKQTLKNEVKTPATVVLLHTEISENMYINIWNYLTNFM